MARNELNFCSIFSSLYFVLSYMTWFKKERQFMTHNTHKERQGIRGSKLEFELKTTTSSFVTPLVMSKNCLMVLPIFFLKKYPTDCEWDDRQFWYLTEASFFSCLFELWWYILRTKKEYGFAGASLSIQSMSPDLRSQMLLMAIPSPTHTQDMTRKNLFRIRINKEDGRWSRRRIKKWNHIRHESLPSSLFVWQETTKRKCRFAHSN